jgi:hypothetical protein
MRACLHEAQSTNGGERTASRLTGRNTTPLSSRDAKSSAEVILDSLFCHKNIKFVLLPPLPVPFLSQPTTPSVFVSTTAHRPTPPEPRNEVVRAKRSVYTRMTRGTIGAGTRNRLRINRMRAVSSRHHRDKRQHAQQNNQRLVPGEAPALSKSKPPCHRQIDPPLVQPRHALYRALDVRLRIHSFQGTRSGEQPW